MPLFEREIIDIIRRNSVALERIKPYTQSLDPGIADAAKFAEREIGIRLQEQPAVEPKRPRKVGNQSETEPQ